MQVSPQVSLLMKLLQKYSKTTNADVAYELMNISSYFTTE